MSKKKEGIREGEKDMKVIWSLVDMKEAEDSLKIATQWLQKIQEKRQKYPHDPKYKEDEDQWVKWVNL